VSFNRLSQRQILFTKIQSLTFNLYSLLAPTETVKQIIINIEAGVEVEVTIAA
jgi:hypothetical protein